jgi:type II secretory pathway component PulF
LATFAYQALTAAGERVSGEIDAADARGAIQRLQDGGLIPIEAQPVAARVAGGGSAGSVRGGASASQLTAATRELATLTMSALTAAIDRNYSSKMPFSC